MNSTVKTIMFWAFIVICLVLLFSVVQKSTGIGAKEQDISFSDFQEKVKLGQVNDVAIQGMEVHGHLKGDGKESATFHSTIPQNYPNIYDQLNAAGVHTAVKTESNNMMWTILLQIGPLVLILGIWFFIMRQMQSGGN